MKALYKILFEVKLLHEYYLTNPDNSSVFQGVKQADRLAWLAARYAGDEPAINNDLQFVLPPAMTELFKNQRLLLVPSYAGFQVAVLVTASIQTGGAITYAPLVPIAGDLNILILIRQAAGQFERLTNGRLGRPVKSLYYFSNEQLTAPKVAPVLSNPISPESATYVYEQGELADLGSSIGICYYTGASRLFPPIAGNGFANENDRLIVGTEFDYRFDPTAAVTQASFTLKDHSGSTVRSLSVADQTPLNTITLNFDDEEHPSDPSLVTLPAAKAADPILYSLQVTGTGGYSDSRNLIFYDQPADLLSTWGIIQIQTAVGNSDFNLLDTNGNLIDKPTLPSPDISTSPYPVFEIRCKSRYTFWRYYVDDPSLVLNAPTGSLLDFLQATGLPLTTITPVPSTHLPYFFSTDPGAVSPSFTYLPNPDPEAMIELNGKQVCSDIRVPESALFPASPAS